MERTFRLLFNLHTGEWKKAALFAPLALLWSIGGYGIFVLSEGLFLEQVGADSLPYAYFIIAVAMCLLSTLLIVALNRAPIRWLLFGLIGFWMVVNCFFLLSYSAFSSSTLFWFIFKIGGWITPISIYIVYWAFADLYFDLQDAKRFFCLFNAVTFLGDSIGGGLITFLIDAIGMQGLLTLFTCCLGGSLPLIVIISRKVKPVLEEHSESVDSTSSITFKGLIQKIFSSRFTLYLIVFYFLMQCLAIVTEFSYMHTIENALSYKGEYALSKFIGQCGMWISLANMVLGLFFYSRLVRGMGVNRIVAVAPSFFLFIFTLWFFTDALPIAVFGIVAREGMVYSFDDNNLNLLMTGVPTKIKNQVRITVESFIEPLGMLFGALLLAYFQSQRIYLGLILGSIALCAALLLQAQYSRAIFNNLMASALRFEKKAADWLRALNRKDQKQTKAMLISKLKHGDEKQQLLAYEYLLRFDDQSILPHLLNYVDRLSLRGKLRAIELLRRSPWAKEIAGERLERWQRSFPHPSLREAIHFFLAEQGRLQPKKVAKDLDSPELGLRGAAILALSKSPANRELIEAKLDQLIQSSQEEEVLIGLKVLAASPELDGAHLLPQLMHRLGSTLCHKTRARILTILEHSANVDSIRPLILATTHLRASERRRVQQLIASMGKGALSALLEITLDSTISDRCRLLAGKILGQIDSATLQKELKSLIEKETKRAYFYYYHALEIPKHYPTCDLKILSQALLTSHDRLLDFLVQILGVVGSIEEGEILAHTLSSQNKKIQAQAFETFEKKCDPQLLTVLKPLLFPDHSNSKIEHYLRLGGVPKSLPQLLEIMRSSPSKGNQLIAEGIQLQLGYSRSAQ